MASGSVLHGSREGVHVLRFVGDVRYPIAPSLSELLERVFAAGEVTGFVVDLSEATSIDSTNLGVLARLGVQVEGRCHHRATVVAPSADIRALLDSMGIDGVCEIIDRAPAVADASAVVAADAPATEDELARVMLDAHRALMDRSRANREQCRDGVAMLERAADDG